MAKSSDKFTAKDLKAAQDTKLAHDKERARKLYHYSKKTYSEIALILGRDRSSVTRWCQEAEPAEAEGKNDENIIKFMKQEDEIKELKTQLLTMRRTSLTEQVASTILTGIAEHPIRNPNWLLKPHVMKDMGTPILFLSDLHWGERVEASEINGINSYDTPIAKKRLRRCFERSSGLIQSTPGYMPKRGLVILLGGDMVSGDIHDELRETNDAPPTVALLDLAGELSNNIGELLDKNIVDRIHIECVTGNHGRSTIKPRAKRRVFSNYDWLLYKILQREFSHNSKITINVPSGPDALFNVGGWPCLLTHGDMMGVKGGDGIIGILGPVARGDFKMRNQSSQEGKTYNTLFLGHYHQSICIPQKLIVNGSLPGPNEYSRNMLRAMPEAPSQTLIHLHGHYGITDYKRVFVEDVNPIGNSYRGKHVLDFT